MNSRLTLLLIVITAILSTQARSIHDSFQTDTDGDMPVRVRYLPFKEAPVEINLPEGFRYVDERDSKEILINAGNDSATINKVIGIIVADTALQNFYPSWILTYDVIGHVQDNRASTEDFSWILDDTRDSDGNSNATLDWAWAPKYDTEHHLLSLPFKYVEGGDTVINHRQFLFGNDGLITVETLVTHTDQQLAQEYDSEIIKAIGFKPGARYEDFNYATQAPTYYSLTALLKGVPDNPSVVASDENDDSFNSIVISSIGIVAGILVAVLLLLMLLVAVTNKRDETGKDIIQTGINVLLRIGVFGVVYLMILTLAVFLVWAGVWLTILILSEAISIRILLLIAGGWFLIGSFLWATIRSLFYFSRPKYPNRTEIFQRDAPKLFALIKDISQCVGEKMPKHVYVSPDVNACVFYDKPFLNLFVKGRKNLEIGLGLLFGINQQEFKAIIAHEYGHVSQNSMHIGQIISICYNIISNLVNSERTSILRPVLNKTFAYVQRGYMSLSRAMEYEADEMSAKVAGNEAAISALCKVEVLAGRFNAYNSLLQSIYEEKRMLPTSYWNGYRQFLSLTDKFDGIVIDETVIATAPLSKSPKSKVRLKDPWISHPLLEQRISNIKLLNYSTTNRNQENIEDLVPAEVYSETSRNLFANLECKSGEVCNNSEYRELLTKELEENSFPMNLRVFFSREICGFKVDENDISNISLDADHVFSEKNAEIIESFTQAISDYQTMLMFKNNQTTENRIQYDGKIYSRNNVPVDTQLGIIKDLEPSAIYIDKNIYLLALTKASDKSLIAKAYDNIFYSQAVIRHIAGEVVPFRDNINNQIGKGGNVSEESFKRVQQILLNFKKSMKELMDNIEINRLNPVMHVEAVKSLKRIDDELLLACSSISGDEIQYIMSLPDVIIAQFRALLYYSKKIVTDTIEGKTPLLFWNNSVASQANQTVTE